MHCQPRSYQASCAIQKWLIHQNTSRYRCVNWSINNYTYLSLYKLRRCSETKNLLILSNAPAVDKHFQNMHIYIIKRPQWQMHGEERMRAAMFTFGS